MLEVVATAAGVQVDTEQRSAHPAGVEAPKHH
jgi:hypothetical protein